MSAAYTDDGPAPRTKLDDDLQKLYKTIINLLRNTELYTGKIPLNPEKDFHIIPEKDEREINDQTIVDLTDEEHPQRFLRVPQSKTLKKMLANLYHLSRNTSLPETTNHKPLYYYNEVAPVFGNVKKIQKQLRILSEELTHNVPEGLNQAWPKTLQECLDLSAVILSPESIPTYQTGSNEPPNKNSDTQQSDTAQQAA